MAGSSAWTPNPSPSLAPGPGERARLELLLDPERSNLIIADVARCHIDTVEKARAYLEDLGEIPPVGAWDRRRRGREAEPGRWSRLPPMPPELARGLCVASPDPDLWLASTDPARRAEAIATCHRCPALGPCRDWSLNLPTSEKGTIWGGLSYTARVRLRKQRQAEAEAATAGA